MKTTRKYYQLIPEKVKKEFSTIEDFTRQRITGYCRDYLNETISIVASHVLKDEEATPLKMAYLKKLVPQGHRYLSALLEFGVIKRSGHYTPGQVAYKYAFTPKYESKYVTSSLDNTKLIRRIEKAFGEFNREAFKSVRGRSEQVPFLKQLTIAPGFMNFINENYGTSTDAFNRVLASAIRIVNGDIFYKIDNTSGRFHSNVTNTPKGFRPYLRVKNEMLVNIDVKNCQPYLSTIILTDPLKASCFTENPAFAMVLQTLKISYRQDVKKYISLVKNGNFYEYLMQAFARDGLHLDRTETKRQVLRILFARNRMPKDEINRKARIIFRSNFPTVHRIFSKVRGNQRGDKFESYKRFAILLQKIESYLLLDVILKRIYRELPGVVALTIHDSIMTGILTDNVNAVIKIMKEEMTFFAGFSPFIKIEGLGEEIEEKKGRIYLLEQYDSTAFVSVN